MINIGIQDKAAIAVGETGPRGPRGHPGPATTIGATGPQGRFGHRGESGPPGPKGDTGPLGPSGPQGESGPIGIQGPTGVQGIEGPRGETGPVGPEGPPGPATTIGATGSTGPVFPAAVCFTNGMTVWYDNLITPQLKQIGDVKIHIANGWNYTSNGFLNGIISFKFHQQQIQSILVTMNATIYVNEQNVLTITGYMSGSGQLYLMGLLPNLSVGDVLDIILNANTESGNCLIVENSSLAGAIYHVS